MAGLWYRTGSVAVTQSSKKITGTGTSWLTALNRPSKGNVFYGPDGKAYEIDYISSETELYLVDAYAGANASAQSYKIDVRGGTVPELSRQLSEHYAYMQGIIDSLQSIVSGSGDVTVTGPSGQTVTVPALANMLSKSGNLAGLADKPIARNNLGLGDAATKSVGTAANTVAAGNHVHTRVLSVGGDPNTFYPVFFNGPGLSSGVSLNRNIHQDIFYGGSLSFHMTGAGYGWGSNNPYLEYQFAQLWGGGAISGCIADAATANALDGVFLWLRGGRTYDVTCAGAFGTTVYLSGMTDDLGSAFMPKTSGPLYQLTSVTSIASAQLYSGPPGNNKPYWNGENFPVVPGAFTPTINLTGVDILKASGMYWRKGDRCDFEIDFTFGSLADGAAGDTSSLIIRSLPFVKADTGMVHIISLMERNLRVDKPVAYVNGSTVELFKRVGEDTIPVKVQDIKPKTYDGWVTVTLSGWYPIA